MATPAGVHGTVRSGEGLPLRGVRVEVDGTGQAVTDSLGHYAVGALLPGSHDLRFVAPWYAPRRMSVLLSDASDLALDVELSPVVVILPSIGVTAAPPTATAVSAPSRAEGTAELGQYRIGSGWQGDMLTQGVDIQKAIAAVPGVVGRGEDATSLSMRGGSASENLWLLDGIPIYGGSHFGNASSAILPDAISYMNVHTGVTSARFGGRLSGVVELETADSTPSAAGITGAVNASDVRALVRGALPMAHGSYLLGGRTSFRSAWQTADGLTQESAYRDFIGVARLNAAGGSLRVVSFLSGNKLGLEPGSPIVVSSATGDSGDNGSGQLSGGTMLGWKSSSIGATWTQLGADGLEVRLRSWYSGATADITWLPEWGSSRLRSTVSELGMSAEGGREWAHGSNLFGLSLVRPTTSYAVAQLSTDAAIASAASTRTATPTTASLFTEWSWRPNNQLVSRIGMRGNATSGARMNVEPRVDISYYTSADTHFDLGAGRTHQTLQSMFNEENLLGTLIGLELPSAANGAIPTASADQIGLGIGHRVSSRITLTADSYLRRWSGVPLPANTTGGVFVTDSVVIGRGHSSGVVLGATYAGRALSAHAAMSFARSVREYDGGSYHAGVERPWSVAGIFDYRLGHRTLAQLSLGAGTGEPSSITGAGVDWRPDHLPTQSGELEGTPVNLPGPVNIERLPGFTRIDVGLRRSWPLGIAGRSGALTTSLRVVNLLNTTNSIGVVAAAGSSLRLVRGTPRGLGFEVGWLF